METGDESPATCVIMCSLFVNIINLRIAVFYEVRFAKIPVLCAHLTYKNAHAVRGRPTRNDVERFRNGLVHELSSLKASQMCKVYTSSHEITNEAYVSSNFENTDKTVTADLTTNYDAEMDTSLAEKIKNVLEHNFEGGANDSELDKDTAICKQLE